MTMTKHRQCSASITIPHKSPLVCAIVLISFVCWLGCANSAPPAGSSPVRDSSGPPASLQGSDQSPVVDAQLVQCQQDVEEAKVRIADLERENRGLRIRLQEAQLIILRDCETFSLGTMPAATRITP